MRHAYLSTDHPECCHVESSTLQWIHLGRRLLPLLQALWYINNGMSRPNMNSRSHHLFIKILQTSTLDIGNRRRAGLFPGCWHRIAEPMQQSSPAILAKQAFQLSALQRGSGVAPHEIGDWFWKLKVGEYGRDAEGGGALMAAFGAVAGMEAKRFVCGRGEFYLATLTAGVHSHVGECGVVRGWL